MNPAPAGMGLVKAKKFNIEDSNIEMIGSDLYVIAPSHPLTHLPVQPAISGPKPPQLTC